MMQVWILLLSVVILLTVVEGFVYSRLRVRKTGIHGSLSMSKGKMIELSDQSFDDLVLRSSVPVIVDFHANWCGPCKLMAPIFKELAEEYPEESIKFVKVDTDDHEDTVDKFNIQGLPMFVLIKDGKVLASHSGAISREPLKAFIDKHVGAPV